MNVLWIAHCVNRFVLTHLAVLNVAAIPVSKSWMDPMTSVKVMLMHTIFGKQCDGNSHNNIIEKRGHLEQNKNLV